MCYYFCFATGENTKTQCAVLVFYYIVFVVLTCHTLQNGWGWLQAGGGGG